MNNFDNGFKKVTAEEFASCLSSFILDITKEICYSTANPLYGPVDLFSSQEKWHIDLESIGESGKIKIFKELLIFTMSILTFICREKGITDKIIHIIWVIMARELLEKGYIENEEDFNEFRDKFNQYYNETFLKSISASKPFYATALVMRMTEGLDCNNELGFPDFFAPMQLKIITTLGMVLKIIRKKIEEFKIT